MKTIKIEVDDNFIFDENKKYKLVPFGNKRDNVTMYDAEVGDEFVTNLDEDGRIISTNGPHDMPFIGLILRNDVQRDDIVMFSGDGIISSNYYIVKHIKKYD